MGDSKSQDLPGIIDKNLGVLISIVEAVHKSSELKEIYNTALDLVVELEKVDMAVIYRSMKPKTKQCFRLSVTSRKTTSKTRPIYLTEKVKRIVENLLSFARTDPSLPRTMVDANQLRRVFTSIILNASHAVANMSNEGGKLEITISEHGPGMGEEVLKMIFDPFFTTKPPGIGTGLGLIRGRKGARGRNRCKQ